MGRTDCARSAEFVVVRLGLGGWLPMWLPNYLSCKLRSGE